MLRNKAPRKRKVVISQLSEKICMLQERMPLTEKDAEIYNKSVNDLEERQLARAEGLIFRSRAQWIGEGERNTKYFYNLEKSRYNAKTCKKLITEDGQELVEDDQILKEQYDFYSALYDKEEGVSFDIKNTYGVRLDEEDVNLCTMEFTEQEMLNAVKSLKNGKTPGKDGLPAEVYKMFWKKISPILFSAIKFAKEQEGLFSSALLGVLNLIPKANKDSRFFEKSPPYHIAKYRL